MNFSKGLILRFWRKTGNITPKYNKKIWWLYIFFNLILYWYTFIAVENNIPCAVMIRENYRICQFFVRYYNFQLYFMIRWIIKRYSGLMFLHCQSLINSIMPYVLYTSNNIKTKVYTKTCIYKCKAVSKMSIEICFDWLTLIYLEYYIYLFSVKQNLCLFSVYSLWHNFYNSWRKLFLRSSYLRCPYWAIIALAEVL